MIVGFEKERERAKKNGIERKGEEKLEVKKLRYIGDRKIKEQKNILWKEERRMIEMKKT